MIKTDTAILGAGASGLFLAKFMKNSDYILVDKSEIPLKLKVSGGGKCNFTNEYISKENYLYRDDFVQKVLSFYTNRELLRFFKDIGYQKVKNNQYFAYSSDDVIKKLNQKKFIADIEDVEKSKDIFRIQTSKGVIMAKRVVVATGGLSYKKLGATDTGYKIAKKFGHDITPLKPALVGLSLQKEQFWMKRLSGVCFRAKVSVANKSFCDDILFSHRGVTGPAILNASLYWDRGDVKIDFLPDFHAFNSKKALSNALPLPKRFIVEFLKANSLEDKPLNSSKKALELLKSYKFAPAGNFGYDKAEVTKGGVKLKELDDFESKFEKSLYFIGEVLETTGELGGYNLQWCFSSAKYLAAKLSNSKKERR
ncbi:MAG: aminoacetone oxidase family FAD-binding enzyme [Epsilonproteobacteria bacterium]|nr:aminoacetone oxidase family FAD-binding enzyme [Campylobacterota bacterium]